MLVHYSLRTKCGLGVLQLQNMDACAIRVASARHREKAILLLFKIFKDLQGSMADLVVDYTIKPEKQIARENVQELLVISILTISTPRQERNVAAEI